MTYSVPDARVLVLPLRLVFWGAVLCILDFNVGYETAVSHTSDRTLDTGVTVQETIVHEKSGISVDILSDFVGLILIFVAIRRLRRQPAGLIYRSLMTSVLVVVFLAAVWALIEHFVFIHPAWLDTLIGTVEFAIPLAVLAFCWSMQRLSRMLQLRGSQASWRITTILFAIILVIPVLMFSAAMAVIPPKSLIEWTTRFLSTDGVIGIFLASLLMLIPWIHLFVSTSRMKKEIVELSDVSGPASGASEKSCE